jgi:hypothetical protein
MGEERESWGAYGVDSISTRSDARIPMDYKKTMTDWFLARTRLIHAHRVLRRNT